MGELEFQRKLTESSDLFGERERAEGESAGDSEPSDDEDSDSEEDNEIKGKFFSSLISSVICRYK